jgi:hypothetical protein
MIIKLPDSLRDWETPELSKSFKREIQCLPPGALPLQSRGMQNGLVDDTDLSPIILQAIDTEDMLTIKAGIFFSEIIGGCSCGDEPAVENAYCEIRVEICKATAEASILLAEN